MQELGRILIGIAMVLGLLGLLLWVLGRLGFRGLPGDIRYETEQVRFYFPIVSSLVVSAVLSFTFWLWQRFMHK